MQNAAPIQTAMISAISNACKVKLNCSTKHGAEKNSNKNTATLYFFLKIAVFKIPYFLGF